MRTRLAILAVTLLLWTSFAYGGEGKAVDPGPKDKCPVCGMFVAPYANWIAGIVFKDGSRAFFDGPKDMFKYYFDIPKYAKGKAREEVAKIFVTDYYTTKRIAAEEAHFVLGSDVNGPMGEELVPVKGRKEAEQFLKDHNGKTILPFDKVTPGDIPGMARGNQHGR